MHGEVRHMQILYTKKKLCSFAPVGLCLVAMGILLFFPDVASEKIAAGIRICTEKVIPSVFPFTVLCRIFISLGGAELFSKALSPFFRRIFKLNGACASAFILGSVSGYPSGAVCASELYDEGICTKDEAERLCAFSNNASPAFLIGAIGKGFFSSNKMGYFFCLAQLAASVISGIILSRGKKASTSKNDKRFIPQSSLSHSVNKAVSDSVMLMLKICGTILFFELLCGLAEEILAYLEISPYISSLIFGASEISYAAEYLSTADMNSLHKAVFTSAFVGWSGASVHMQVKEAVAGRFSLTPYIKGKLICTVFSTILMYILISVK
ncbi:MAG: hypothetical protein E7623_00050 [Ruminococcaceae bacterium]|nr:hypothetical protein [Oscillospiraceae bacterium]